MSYIENNYLSEEQRAYIKKWRKQNWEITCVQEFDPKNNPIIVIVFKKETKMGILVFWWWRPKKTIDELNFEKIDESITAIEITEETLDMSVQFSQKMKEKEMAQADAKLN